MAHVFVIFSEEPHEIKKKLVYKVALRSFDEILQ